MNAFRFVLDGVTPLLMHRDDVDAAEAVSLWRDKNKGKMSPGSDKTPSWTWQTYLYTDGTKVCMPTEIIMAALRNAGSSVTFKKQKTLKSVSQSGLLIRDEFLRFTFGENRNQELFVADLPPLDATYEQNVTFAAKTGFQLFVKRAVVGMAKHIRVRPRFNPWRVTGIVEVIEDTITDDMVRSLFSAACNLGLCDWRPGSKRSPGNFGIFTANLEKVK